MQSIEFRRRFGSQVELVERSLVEEVSRRARHMEGMLLRALDLDRLGSRTSLSKRLRGVLLLIVHEGSGCGRQECSRIAAALEMVHAASLLADDFQDKHRERWGREALWLEFGAERVVNVMTLLVGMAVESAGKWGGDFGAEEALGETLARMAEAQEFDLRLASGERRQCSLDQYIEMVRGKTGALLRVAAELGAHLFCKEDRAVFGAFAETMGVTHQIWDDIDDLERPDREIGLNNVGAFFRGQGRQEKIELARGFADFYRREAESLLALASVESGPRDDLSSLVRALFDRGARAQGRRGNGHHSGDAINW